MVMNPASDVPCHPAAASPPEGDHESRRAETDSLRYPVKGAKNLRPRRLPPTSTQTLAPKDLCPDGPATQPRASRHAAGFERSFTESPRLDTALHPGLFTPDRTRPSVSCWLLQPMNDLRAQPPAPEPRCDIEGCRGTDRNLRLSEQTRETHAWPSHTGSEA